MMLKFGDHGLYPLDIDQFICKLREFPGGPAVRTWRFTAIALGSIPGWGTKIPEATWSGQKK